MSSELKLADLEQRVVAIEQRNQRVESNKAWEISLLRKLTIASLTFLIAATYMYSINVDTYLLNALIPTGGYILSTLALDRIRRWFEKNK